MNVKRLFLLVALVSPVAFGAENGGVDTEARKRSIPVLESHIKEREARLMELGDDIVAIHRRIDGRLERMVARLAMIRDSTRSGVRISQIKLKLINDLRGAIEAYQSKRAEVFEDRSLRVCATI